MFNVFFFLQMIPKMKSFYWLALVSLVTFTSATVDYAKQMANDMDDLINTVMATLAAFDERLIDLTNHVLLQDLYSGEKLRSEGQSGIKLQRLRNGGTRPFHLSSHSGHRIAGMHNHANFERTIGLGEMVAVINGVEFRTRHNDYSLYQPSTTSHDLLATDDIPFPDVPPRVMRQPTIDGQITEMREWFKSMARSGL